MIAVASLRRVYGLPRNRVQLPRNARSASPESAPHLRKRYWGQHLWARGYFCATVGAVDEKAVMRYIENQKWDEDAQGFKVTAP